MKLEHWWNDLILSSSFVFGLQVYAYHVKFDNLAIAIFSITSFGILYKNIDEWYKERNKQYS